ncbi:M56 family metallopeptidase [Flavobacterium sp. 120]|uniref:M56 family metallopeptidase n=1 Tax=Flavobacterium sp. 120 TaxID=2135626 RepID=UPI000EAF8F22|nr:M56 family metallopeptidase [Flavobacterium sp. 120]RKS14452.1 BlaR1 peptidase M56 [Flavobacterium sp. 120]
MEALYIYLIKSSGLIALFYLAYYFMLRKETFFTSNRWFLLLGLFTSVVLPLIVYTKIIMVESSSKNIDWSRIPITNSIENEAFEINWYIVFGITYAIGIILFLGKFAFDFYSLNTVLKGKTIQNQADFKFIDTTENVAPFSYFNTIVYNSSLYSSSELENILEHEKVHSDQNHTVDVLISRLFCILFWFNPLIWLYKKAILQNLEFIADNEATKNISDKKAYQFTLLKITTHENCVAITNHFYQSLIKKRIVMLNKNQSKKSNSWKYALVLPALIAFVLLFQIKTIAQEKNEIKIEKYSVKTEFHITSKSTTEELNSIKKFFKDENDLEISFSGIKTNKNDEIIAIKVKLKDKKGSQKIYQTSEETPIKSFTIFAENDINNNLNFGFSANLKDNAHLKNHFDHINALNTPKDEVAPNTEVKEIPVPPTPPNAKEIFINGKKASQKEVDALDPNKIESVNVKKDDNTISIVIKNKTSDASDDSQLMISGVNMTELNLEKIDPNNINNKQTTKTTRTIKIINNKTSGISDDTEIYIDGVKSDKTELDKINPNLIERMDVSKSATEKNTIKITTKKEK